MSSTAADDRPASAPRQTCTKPREAKILVFDSGLGGLSVMAEIVRLRPAAHYVYAADDAMFPYGELTEADLVGRVVGLMQSLIPHCRPDVVVIACNTASVSVLPPLRARWPELPFVGTVPAIKPAAAQSRSRAISILATPGTVAREYTRDLVRAFADDCSVTLVGAPRLAALAEAALRGQAVDDAAIEAEIAPAFVDQGGRRTDVVALACTHYPLLRDRLAALSPWPVVLIDPAPAIARRTHALLDACGIRGSLETQETPRHVAMFSSAAGPEEALRRALDRRGFGSIRRLPSEG